MESSEGKTLCGDLGARRAERRASNPGREGGLSKLASIRFSYLGIGFDQIRDYETKLKRNELLRFAFQVVLSIAVVVFCTGTCRV